MFDPWSRCLVPLPPGPIPQALGVFLEDQAVTWPRLGAAIEALSHVRTRTVRVGQRTVVVQWNPARVASTTAQVDPATIQARPCFLCPDNLPPEERGIGWGERLVVLANPAPIMPDHLVLTSRTHQPQALLPVLDDLLAFAKAAAPGFSVLYNGPACGASAPDHLHLQAVRSTRFPLENLVRTAFASSCVGCPTSCPSPGPGRTVLHAPDVIAWSFTDQAPGFWAFHGSEAGVNRCVQVALQVLGPPPEGDVEPAVNVLAWADRSMLTLLLFPRTAHRPACFWAPEPERVLLSPATFEMAGQAVTIRESDFARVDAALLKAIYQEVSPPLARFRDWEAELARRLAHG